MMTWGEGFLRVAQDKDIKGETYRVLFTIIGIANGQSFADIAQAEIAAILTMTPRSVNRAIKLLEQKQIISKRYEGGKLVGYRISQYFGV
jgi:DNA-binding MarR family transcriptional regulator